MKRLLQVESLTNASFKDGRMAPSTSNKKDLGVITPLVTGERERGSFFYMNGFFSLCMRRPYSCQGLLGVSAYF